MQRERRPSRHTLSVLRVFLARCRAWHYGYELSELTGLASGTLYPILMRLCDRKMLESRWQPAAQPGCPPRHLYRLTSAGLAFAREATSAEVRAVQSRHTAAQALT